MSTPNNRSLAGSAMVAMVAVSCGQGGSSGHNEDHFYGCDSSAVDLTHEDFYLSSGIWLDCQEGFNIDLERPTSRDICSAPEHLDVDNLMGWLAQELFYIIGSPESCCVAPFCPEDVAAPSPSATME